MIEFSHTPVMLSECLEGLNIRPDGIYVDGTLGGAGHSSEILKRLTTGRLIGIDKDSTALEVARERLNKISDRFTLVHSDFKDFKNVLDELGVDKVDGVLLDLGVSSYQLDTPERGFSYRFDAPLDMRMDRDNSLSAYDVVNGYSEKDLAQVIYKYGEDSFGGKIARAIVKQREEAPIKTTMELVKIIENVVPKKFQIGGSPCKKTFQAIRIEVNGELKGLDTVLHDIIDRLNTSGRLAVITFHSLEDRIAKTAFKTESQNCICDKSIPVCICHHKARIRVLSKPIIASKDELEQNKRSKSAKLRVVEKI